MNNSSGKGDKENTEPENTEPENTQPETEATTGKEGVKPDKNDIDMPITSNK